MLAIMGIMYQQLFHERFKMLETVFYLVIGVMPSLAVMDMVSLTLPSGGVRKREGEGDKVVPLGYHNRITSFTQPDRFTKSGKGNKN